MSVETNTISETKYRSDLKKVCNFAYQKGLLSSFDGNLSLKINDDLILITPKECHKGLVQEEDFVLVDMNGSIVSNSNKKPTSDLQIHLEAYRSRKDIKAFIHAHPPTVVSLTVAGVEINSPVLPDVIVSLGEIPTIQYSGPDRKKETELTIECLANHDVVVLEKHGAVTVGKNVFQALYRMELLEYAAKVIYQAQTIGEVETLDENQIEELIKERCEIYGEEIAGREDFKSLQRGKNVFKLKNIFKKIFNSNSSVFQRILDLTNEIILATLSQTTYSTKLSKEEKEVLSRELTASLLSMILGRFTGKK